MSVGRENPLRFDVCTNLIATRTFYFVSVLNLANGGKRKKTERADGVADAFVGTAGLLVGTIIACAFMAPVYISIAEKIRKYPTAGGQYHW